MSPDLHALICDRIQRFSSQCEEDEYTDTDEAWELLDWIIATLQPDVPTSSNAADAAGRRLHDGAR
jgi:hypothetical protein